MRLFRAAVHAHAAALVMALPASALAQEPDWSRAPTVTVTLSSFDYTPATIRLRAGEPVVLRLVNASGKGHDFSAPEFFAAAQLRASDRALLAKGTIEVKGKAAREVALRPAAGRYRLRCTHFMHSAFGMKGEIVVE
jgi:plastocyanin